MKVDVFTADGTLREAKADDHTYKVLPYGWYNRSTGKVEQRFGRFDDEEAMNRCLQIWNVEGEPDLLMDVV